MSHVAFDVCCTEVQVHQEGRREATFPGQRAQSPRQHTAYRSFADSLPPLHQGGVCPLGRRERRGIALAFDDKTRWTEAQLRVSELFLQIPVYAYRRRRSHAAVTFTVLILAIFCLPWVMWTLVLGWVSLSLQTLPRRLKESMQSAVARRSSFIPW